MNNYLFPLHGGKKKVRDQWEEKRAQLENRAAGGRCLL